MASPIPYAIINGNRHSFTSVVLKIDGQEFSGFTAVKLNRKRDRKKVWGNNPDPIGKTRGQNDYEHSVTVLVAEFKAFVLDHFGAGYGDAFFSNEVTLTESGFDTQTHLVQGCTIDTSAFDAAQGNEAIMMEIDFSPIKILFNGVDDNKTPLAGAPAQA